MEVEREDGWYVTVWLSREEEQLIPAPVTDGEGTMRFINHLGVAEQMNSRKGVVDVK